MLIKGDLGRSIPATERYQRANQYLNSVLSSNPANQKGVRLKAEVLLRRGQINEAIETMLRTENFLDEIANCPNAASRA